MLDAVAYPLRAVPSTGLPISDLVIAKPAEDASELLPRLFSLCREAQQLAARAAFGLPVPQGWTEALRAEILREHVVKLCLKWPGLMSQRAVPLPRDWQSNPSAVRRSLFGTAEAMPQTFGALEDWFANACGIAPVLGGICALFAPGEAVREALPIPTGVDMFTPGAKENSAAARHADHPVMRQVEVHWGRGPFWSALGVTYDAEAVLNGHLPTLILQSHQSVVPAARGLYGVRASVVDGIVTEFERVTPTDHLLVPDGALDQCLGSLPAHRAKALAPLLLSIMDPCFPVSLDTAKDLTNA